MCHLDELHPNNKLGEGCTIWGNTNIYNSTIGNNVSVGFGTEVGGAVVGNNVRIGAGCFLCEGVMVGDNVFIAPHVCFTNDKYPPSSKENWLKTIVQRGASIGAGSVIVCGITIGEGAKIGAGSVVTKDVPPMETWAGVPARSIK